MPAAPLSSVTLPIETPPITGTSFVPVMVTSICLLMTPPFWSSSVMVKLSTLVWPAPNDAIAESATV